MMAITETPQELANRVGDAASRRILNLMALQHLLDINVSIERDPGEWRRTIELTGPPAHMPHFRIGERLEILHEHFGFTLAIVTRVGYQMASQSDTKLILELVSHGGN